MNRKLKPTRVPMFGALIGLFALLGFACGSDVAEPAQAVSAVATPTAQSQAAPPATATPVPTPIATVQASLADRLDSMSATQPTPTVDRTVPTPTATPLPDAESVVGSGVPTPPADPENQPDPPELGTPLINITLPRAGSEEVVDLATFDPDKNIVIVFYRAFW